MTPHWQLSAELGDTIRNHRSQRAKEPCIYCGRPTQALSRVCLAHDDLIDLDPGYPAVVLEQTDVPVSPSPGPQLGNHARASVSSSATVEPHGSLRQPVAPALVRGNGRGGVQGRARMSHPLPEDLVERIAMRLNQTHRVFGQNGWEPQPLPPRREVEPDYGPFWTVVFCFTIAAVVIVIVLAAQGLVA